MIFLCGTLANSLIQVFYDHIIIASGNEFAFDTERLVVNFRLVKSDTELPTARR